MSKFVFQEGEPGEGDPVLGVVYHVLQKRRIRERFEGRSDDFDFERGTSEVIGYVVSGEPDTIRNMETSEAIAACAGVKALYPRLMKLALLIQEFEGYESGPAGRSYDGTMSFRNNNPGNLRSSPFSRSSHEGYAVFNDYFEGLYALLWDLWSKCQGRTSTDLNPKSTLKEMVRVHVLAGDSNDLYLSEYCKFLESGLQMFEREIRLYWFLEG